MSNLICPFCNSELHKDSDGYYTCYTDNCGCWANGGNGASGSESLWLTLIHTRRALGVAKKENDMLKTQLATGTGGISNNYTVIEYAKLCELLKAQDELLSLKGLKPFMN